MGKKKKDYKGDQMAVVIWIPTDTVKMTIKTKKYIPEYDELKTLECKMNQDEIKEARNDYLLLDPDDDAFATYALSDEFREFWEDREGDGKTLEEIFDEWASIHNA